jgi:hypothetical protein
LESPLQPSPDAGFTDRSSWLVLGGALLIAAGVVAALLGLLSAAAPMLARGMPGQAGDSGQAPFLWMGVLFYEGLAALLIVLGVGSLRARRWALALVQIVLWTWLFTGILSVLFVVLLVPSMVGPQVVGAQAGMMPCLILVALVMGALLVVVPLVLLLVYRRQDVRRTVEVRDPGPAWTDRLPLSLLGIVLALAVSALFTVVSLFGIRAVPLLGIVIVGWPAKVVLLGIAALLAVLTVAVYRRSEAGWWGLILLQILQLANLVTMRGLNMPSLLRQMGYPEEQVRIAGQFSLFDKPAFLILMAAAWIALLLFLLAVRKYFRSGFAVGAPPSG